MTRTVTLKHTGINFRVTDSVARTLPVLYCRLFATPDPSELNGSQSGCSVTKA